MYICNSNRQVNSMILSLRNVHSCILSCYFKTVLSLFQNHLFKFLSTLYHIKLANILPVVALKSVLCVIWLQSDLKCSLNYFFNGNTYTRMYIVLCVSMCVYVCGLSVFYCPLCRRRTHSDVV